LRVLIPLPMTNYGRSSDDVFHFQLSCHYISMYRSVLMDDK